MLAIIKRKWYNSIRKVVKEMEKQFYKVSEVAKIIGCTPQQVYNYFKNAENPLPHYVVGKGQKIVKISDFEKWIEEGKVD